MFIKEVCQLIGMLFSSTKVDKVVMKPMKHFPFSGYKYMMWCGNLIYRESRPEFGNLNAVDENHESIHIRQAQDTGFWIVYYLKYLWEWLKGNPFSAKNGAYYTSKYEIEAYAKEYDLTYLSRRTDGNVRQFVIPDRKKTFRECRYSYQFKSYIRNLFKDI